MTNLAILGCGNIAQSHVPAMKSAGFKISAIAGRPSSSEKLHQFAIDNNLGKVAIYNNPDDLIDAHNWDAILLSCPTEPMLGYIKSLINKKKPILAEKPVSYNSENLKELINSENIRVAYNRRFYKTVSYAKNFVSKNNNLIVKVSIPEMSNLEFDAKNFPEKLPIKSYENSIHVIDILRYTVGNFEIEYKKNLSNKKNYIALIGIGETEGGNTVIIDSCYNSSDNFKIEFISKTKRLELKPLEFANLYDGMKISEPSKKMPIRSYSPIIIDSLSEISENDFKFGFLDQAHDFMKFCNGYFSKAATVNDSFEALKIIEKLKV